MTIKIDPAGVVARRMAESRQAVQAHIDATAASRGYNDAATLASYVSSTIAPWAAEASAFVAWRDAVWVAVFDALAVAQDGDTPAPKSAAALIATLPAISTPARSREGKGVPNPRAGEG